MQACSRARLHLAAARPRPVARPARRRQHLGQARATTSSARRRHPLREGQRLGPGDDRGRGLRAGARSTHVRAARDAGARSPTRRWCTSCGTRSLDPARPRRRSRRSCTRSCPTGSSTTRTPTRCSRSSTRPTARSASARSTATRVVVVPYVMPGFDLARAARASVPPSRRRGTIGMVLLQPRHLLLRRDGARVLRADDRAGRRGPRSTCEQQRRLGRSACRRRRAASPIALRRSRSCAATSRAAAGVPLLARHDSTAHSLGFAQRRDVARLSQQGPATPDHVIRTKRVPLLGRDVDALRSGVPRLLRRSTPQRERAEDDARPGAARGRSTRSSASLAAGTRARRTPPSPRRSTTTPSTSSCAPSARRLARAPGRSDIFDVEYWDLEQAKLRKAASPPAVRRRGRAGHRRRVGHRQGLRVEAFLERGAAVVGLDLNPAIADARERADFLGLTLRRHRRRGESTRRSTRRCGASAASTCWC